VHRVNRIGQSVVREPQLPRRLDERHAEEVGEVP
jgi:hypothetical protein